MTKPETKTPKQEHSAHGKDRAPAPCAKVFRSLGRPHPDTVRAVRDMNMKFEVSLLACSGIFFRFISFLFYFAIFLCSLQLSMCSSMFVCVRLPSVWFSSVVSCVGLCSFVGVLFVVACSLVCCTRGFGLTICSVVFIVNSLIRRTIVFRTDHTQKKYMYIPGITAAFLLPGINNQIWS